MTRGNWRVRYAVTRALLGDAIRGLYAVGGQVLHQTVQRRCFVGLGTAIRAIEALEIARVVGPYADDDPRRRLVPADVDAAVAAVDAAIADGLVTVEPDDDPARSVLAAVPIVDPLNLEITREVNRRAMLLETEVQRRLAEGHAPADLVIVSSPVWPRGKVMTRAEEAEHADQLRRGVAHLAAGLAVVAAADPDPFRALIEGADRPPATTWIAACGFRHARHIASTHGIAAGAWRPYDPDKIRGHDRGALVWLADCAHLTLDDLELLKTREAQIVDPTGWAVRPGADVLTVEPAACAGDPPAGPAGG